MEKFCVYLQWAEDDDEKPDALMAEFPTQEQADNFILNYDEPACYFMYTIKKTI